MKNKFGILFLLVLLNIGIRVPATPHELGNDSFVIHWMAESIKRESGLEWILHPVSYFGLYPYSYPSLVPGLLAFLSMLSGLEVELCILFLSIFLGINAVLIGFLLGREFSGRSDVGYLTAFCFSISPVFIKFTYWTASTRNLFVVFVGLILLLFIKFENTRKNIFLGLGLSFIFASMHVHRSFLLIFAVIIPAYLLTKLFFHLKRNKNFRELLFNRLHILLPVVFLVFFSLQFSKIGFFMNLRRTYKTGLFLSGESVVVVFFNMCVDYISRMGLPFFFAPVGFIFLIKKLSSNKLSSKDLFLLLCLLGGALIMLNGKYVTLFLLPVFSVLSSEGIVRSVSMIRQKRRHYFISSILVFSVFFSAFMIYHWSLKTETGDKISWDSATVSAAEYVKNERACSNLVSYDKLLRRRVSAYSYKPFIPQEKTQEVVHGQVDKNNLKIDPVVIELSRGKMLWFAENYHKINREWRRLLGRSLSSPESMRVMDYYNIGCVVEYKRDEEKLTRYPFYRDMMVSGDKIYENSKHVIWSY